MMGHAVEIGAIGWIETGLSLTRVSEGEFECKRQTHSVFASILAVFAIGHIGMALIHHFLSKDGALKRMLPQLPHVPCLSKQD